MLRHLTLIGLSFFSLSAFAEIPLGTTTMGTTPTTTEPQLNPDTTYTIAYVEKSPIKHVPLQNTTLKVMVFYNGNPMGIEEVSTDADGNFTFDKYKDGKAIRLEVISVNDQNKFNARCRDTESPSDLHQIQIVCEPVT
jgi:hypothetical protein